MKNTSNMSHRQFTETVFRWIYTVLLMNYVLKMRGGPKSLEDLHKNTLSYYKQSIYCVKSSYMNKLSVRIQQVTFNIESTWSKSLIIFNHRGKELIHQFIFIYAKIHRRYSNNANERRISVLIQIFYTQTPVWPWIPTSALVTHEGILEIKMILINA